MLESKNTAASTQRRSRRKSTDRTRNHVSPPAVARRQAGSPPAARSRGAATSRATDPTAKEVRRVSRGALNRATSTDERHGGKQQPRGHRSRRQQRQTPGGQQTDSESKAAEETRHTHNEWRQQQRAGQPLPALDSLQRGGRGLGVLAYSCSRARHNRIVKMRLSNSMPARALFVLAVETATKHRARWVQRIAAQSHTRTRGRAKMKTGQLERIPESVLSARTFAATSAELY